MSLLQVEQLETSSPVIRRTKKQRARHPLGKKHKASKWFAVSDEQRSTAARRLFGAGERYGRIILTARRGAVAKQLLCVINDRSNDLGTCLGEKKLSVDAGLKQLIEEGSSRLYEDTDGNVIFENLPSSARKVLQGRSVHSDKYRGHRRPERYRIVQRRAA